MSYATKPTRPAAVAGDPQLTVTPALIILVYAVAVYLLFLAVLGYAAGFFSGLAVPKGIDQGPQTAVPTAVAIDLLLLLLFAVQHTVMARPWFKRRWTRVVPEPAERTSFVLAATLLLGLAQWMARDDSTADAPTRQAANTAMDAIDAMLTELHRLRSRLTGEIRESDDLAAERADAMLVP